LSLSDLFDPANFRWTLSGQRFVRAGLKDVQFAQLSTLSAAYEAYVTNNVTLWDTTGLPMPPLLSGE